MQFLAESQLKQLTKKPISLFWFRRDLRLEDNAGLYQALKNQENVLPMFIFDTEILQSLPRRDARVVFIHQTILNLKNQLNELGSDLLVLSGSPLKVFRDLQKKISIQAIYCNHDYEPEARRRDQQVADWALTEKITFLSYKDQCIFEKNEIVTDQQRPYTVYTPYKKKWLSSLSPFYLKAYPNHLYYNHFLKITEKFICPRLVDLNFEDFSFHFPAAELKTEMLKQYHLDRDFPAKSHATSRLGLHLRFGTLSPRELAREGKKWSDVWLSELIWRDFFMQILWQHPRVVKESFRPQFDQIAWRENSEEFERWCQGQTGYPLVDAGMRELNETGHMHNRVRMVTASFLTKHLLTHWLKGERYFASRLLDYDLAANNGNWQWAAGTGCDAAPYFRIFNPTSQLEKFDPQLKYVKTWVPEYGTSRYVRPIVDHVFARERALNTFNQTLKPEKNKKG